MGHIEAITIYIYIYIMVNHLEYPFSAFSVVV